MLLPFDTLLSKARQTKQALVQIRVLHTEGSTYRKTGARMLIDELGGQFDVVSGGCLETHLLRHATKVFNQGKPLTLTYDFADEDAPDWQISLGCRGKVTLLLEKLCPDNDYGSLSLYLQARRAEHTSWLTTHLQSGVSQLHKHPPAPNQHEVIETIPPAPKLLIIGTGVDTDAIIHLAQSLDFMVQVIGCQSQSMQAFNHRFPGFARTVSPAQLGTYLQQSPHDYVLVMTHNQDLDGDYLAQPAIYQAKLVGLLGPESRKQAIIDKLSKPIPSHLLAPIGLDLGGHGTHAVALSVMAQLQSHYHQMSSLPLHSKQGGIHD